MAGRREKNPRWNGGRIKKKGYISILMPEHSRADGQGYVSEHILIAEKALGKALPDGVEPHHVNEIKSDNRNENLVLCNDHKYHMLLHQRMRAYKACGHADWGKCWICKQWDSPQNLVNSRRIIYHKKCNNERSKSLYVRVGKTTGI
jgi:hypothetical protein